VNCENRSRSKNNTSGHAGVYLDKKTGHWRAGIHHWRMIWLGTFHTIAEAVEFRALAEDMLYSRP